MGYIKCKNCKNSQYSTDEDGNKLHWCPIFADSKDMEADRICTRFEPQTNADRIRSMSDEELAEFLIEFDVCDICKLEIAECFKATDCEKRSVKVTTDWLKSEVKE